MKGWKPKFKNNTTYNSFPKMKCFDINVIEHEQDLYAEGYQLMKKARKILINGDKYRVDWLEDSP